MALLPAPLSNPPSCQPHAHSTGTFRKFPQQNPSPGDRCLHSRRPLLLLCWRRGGGMGADYPSFADVSGARALLFLADSSPAPPPPPALSDELSCYSGSSSSSSSFSGASARSCVSDSARRSRPVDPLRVLAVVASLRRINPKVLAEATSTLFHSGAEKKRKGVWIEIDSYDDEEDQSERSSAVASEGSTVTAAASAGSTATSGRCRRPPRASDCGGGGEKPPRRSDVIMQWFSRPQAGPATENDIRAAVGDNSGTSKAIRWLLKQEGGLRREGTGGPLDPYVYMVTSCEIRALEL
ncbi:hypothetical protein C2845_PM03G14850 [Panicum miliaceum]|uniref:HTH three-helical bundle domain-containing protein n=1 Tax=Panicum miliaceum TaxID=4540 RepID=A0A3L6T907_PANMI|nr:hypothetical protein C2845_PM03G14850 [Panicum miliaceum]